MKKKFKISFLIYLFTFSVFSQEYLVRFLDISQGLSNNSVTCIYQERQGYIWFGTNDGLNRYDGYNFKVYRNDVNKKNSIAANYIFCIDGDPQGNIWVGSANGGSVLNAISGEVFQLATDNGTKLIKGESIVQIKAFSTFYMMAACEKSGLVIFKKGQYIGKQAGLKIRGKKISQYHVTSIEPVPEKGFCWVFIKNYGLYKYWIKSQLMEAICSEKLQANYLKSGDNGDLWVGTDEGLFKFEEKHKNYGNNILNRKAIVTNILLNRNKEIYIATDGSGVFKINEQNKAVQFKDEGNQQILKSDAVWGLYEDKDENKWFGTLRGGVSMIGNSKRYFRHIKNTEGNPALNYTLSFCEDTNHNLWIGTDGAGLRLWNRAKNTFTKFTESDGLSSNFIPGIVLDDKHNLWVATWDGGLNKINTLNNKVEHYNLYNPVTKHEERSIWFVFKDSKNTIWSATKEGTLYYRSPLTKKFKVFNSGISGVLCISESSDGNLWVGTYTDLIEINTVTKKITRTKIGYPIRCILEDKKSNFWIGTSEGGLLKFNRKNKSFT
ncbi:MAG: two-component regulator propeller domain-containing protein, partial [Flavobacterium sp.]